MVHASLYSRSLLAPSLRARSLARMIPATLVRAYLCGWNLTTSSRAGLLRKRMKGSRKVQEAAERCVRGNCPVPEPSSSYQAVYLWEIAEVKYENCLPPHARPPPPPSRPPPPPPLSRLVCLWPGTAHNVNVTSRYAMGMRCPRYLAHEKQKLRSKRKSRLAGLALILILKIIMILQILILIIIMIVLDDPI